MPWPLRVTLIVSLILFTVDLIVVWRVINAGKLVQPGSKGRWWWGLVPLIFFIYPVGQLLKFWITGSIEYDGFPFFFIYLFWWGLVFSVQLLILLIPIELLRLPVRILWGKRRNLFDRVYGWVVVLLTVSALFYSAFRVYYDSTYIEVTREQVAVSNLPESMRNLRIVHLSDVQADRFTGKQKLQQLVDKVNRLKPDLVLFTGDLVTEGTRYIDMGARMMGQMNSSMGIAGVIGDHDFWAGKDRVIKALNRQGIRMLEDEHQRIPMEGDTLLISGITHVYSKRAEPDSVQALLERGDSYPAKLFISHQVSPWLIQMVEEYGYNALLAGHTHGGQIEFSFYGRPVSAPRMETDYVRGSYYPDEMLVHINRGIGYTLAPIRYRSAGHISVLELVPAN